MDLAAGGQRLLDAAPPQADRFLEAQVGQLPRPELVRRDDHPSAQPLHGGQVALRGQVRDARRPALQGGASPAQPLPALLSASTPVISCSSSGPAAAGRWRSAGRPRPRRPAPGPGRPRPAAPSAGTARPGQVRSLSMSWCSFHAAAEAACRRPRACPMSFVVRCVPAGQVRQSPGQPQHPVVTAGREHAAFQRMVQDPGGRRPAAAGPRAGAGRAPGSWFPGPRAAAAPAGVPGQPATRAATVAVSSSAPGWPKSASDTRSTCSWMSTRSSSGPDMPRQVAAPHHGRAGAVQPFPDALPQGQGLAARTSWNRAG